MMAPTSKCAYCNKIVKSKQKALQCDNPNCNAWQHICCKTNISSSFYQRLMNRTAVLDNWKCYKCSHTQDTPAHPKDVITADHHPVHTDNMEFDESTDTADIHENIPTAASDFDDPEFPVNQPGLNPVFEILEGGTVRGKDMLRDGIGYTYCKKVNMSFISNKF